MRWQGSKVGSFGTDTKAYPYIPKACQLNKSMLVISCYWFKGLEPSKYNQSYIFWLRDVEQQYNRPY
jgi:hypothetical protein